MPPHVGGIERIAEQLVGIYRDRGHSVTWIATAPPRAAGPTQEDGTARIRIAAVNRLESAFSMPFPLIGPTGLRSIATAVGRADLVHLHDCLYAPVVAAGQAARRFNVPTIVTQHVAVVSFGAAVDPLLRLAYRTIGRRILHDATGLAFVSEQIKQWFATNVDADIGGVVIPNAVDTAMFVPGDPDRRARARAALGLRPGGQVVAFVGRLVPKKGVRLLVAALERLPEAHLLVVGDGPEREALRSLGARVTFHPQLPRQMMPSVYLAADVFCLVSRGEGMPVALIEALSCGLPAVVSDDAGFDALAACAGVVRAPPNAAIVAGTIGSLLGDPTSRARRGEAARQWALTWHGSEAFAARYLALAEDAIAAAAGRRSVRTPR